MDSVSHEDVTDQSSQGTEVQLSSDDANPFRVIEHLRIWMAWYFKEEDGRQRKVPINPATGRPAKTNDPTTWGTRLAAENCCQSRKLDGIGISLTDVGGGLALAGVDLDSCRDPQSSALADWASEVVARIGSYTEISPSQTGGKVSFLMKQEDCEAVRTEIRKRRGEQSDGMKWAHSTGAEHPPAIELFTGGRYFTVTGRHLAETPAELRVVDAEALLWLIRDAGPNFMARFVGANGHDKAPRANDESRSGVAFRTALELRRLGKVGTYDEMTAALRADTNQQKAFMLVGAIRSGKGTIARVLTALVGKDNTVSPTPTSLGGEFGLQPLIDKRVAIIPDARIDAKTNVAVFVERLLSITGEDGITVNRKNKTMWTGRMGVRFLILTNQLPKLTDASGALASRLIILRFTQSFFGKEDLGLTDRLLGELPGILNWAIEGWHRLRERGHFVQPKSSQELVQEMADLSSPIRKFVRDMCEVGAGYEVECGKLFDTWVDWRIKQKYDFAGNRQSFAVELRAAVPGLNTQARSDGPRHARVRERHFVGVRLRTKDYPNIDLPF
jgi:P4 family phage/plasmid primase-like protien